MRRVVAIVNFCLLLVITRFTAAQINDQSAAALRMDQQESPNLFAALTKNAVLPTLMFGAGVTAWTNRYDITAGKAMMVAENTWWDSDLLDIGDSYGQGANLLALSGQLGERVC